MCKHNSVLSKQQIFLNNTVIRRLCSDREERISWLGRKKKSCNLKKYDKYTFTVGLRVPPEANSTQAVNLAVGHRYYHHILQLQLGTRVSISVSRGRYC